MMSAQIAAGIVVRFTPQDGGCWKILERRVRVESKLLRQYIVRSFTVLMRRIGTKTYPHCITTSVKKYTLWASKSRSCVRAAG